MPFPVRRPPAAAVSPAAGRFVISSNDSHVRLYDAASNTLTTLFRAPAPVNVRSCAAPPSTTR